MECSDNRYTAVSSDCKELLCSRAVKAHMTKPEISSIAPFFIVRNVPSALSFCRDRLGFSITFQGPEPDNISSALSSVALP